MKHLRDSGGAGRPDRHRCWASAFGVVLALNIGVIVPAIERLLARAVPAQEHLRDFSELPSDLIWSDVMDASAGWRWFWPSWRRCTQAGQRRA
jgi:hypothetical protein